eukprot:2157551-Pyramimonas_sp.AAC.1
MEEVYISAANAVNTDSKNEEVERFCPVAPHGRSLPMGSSAPARSLVAVAPVLVELVDAILQGGHRVVEAGDVAGRGPERVEAGGGSAGVADAAVVVDGRLKLVQRHDVRRLAFLRANVHRRVPLGVLLLLLPFLRDPRPIPEGDVLLPRLANTNTWYDTLRIIRRLMRKSILLIKSYNTSYNA